MLFLLGSFCHCILLHRKYIHKYTLVVVCLAIHASVEQLVGACSSLQTSTIEDKQKPSKEDLDIPHTSTNIMNNYSLHPSLPPSLGPWNCNQLVQCLLNFNIIQLISGLPLAPHNSFLLLTLEFLCQPGCGFPWRQEAGISTAGACTECQC